jgi:hypothetical protein
MSFQLDTKRTLAFLICQVNQISFIFGMCKLHNIKVHNIYQQDILVGLMHVKNYVNEKRLAGFRRKKWKGWGLLHLTGD